ncbi:MAG TPA: gliding motility-associated C-terminal domain-containing protein [Fluviicola sp.]|nr:gliding motility-associated C-terminal domain-containing protein [Fluviicola sp.]
MKHLVVLLALFTGFDLAAQEWGKNTISDYANEAMDIEIDANGNHYVTGYITGETAFGTNAIQTSAAGNGDIYVAKYAPGGQLIWIKQFGANFSDRGYDLSIDHNQDVIITGQFFGQVAFGATTLTSSANSKDIFLLKLDPSGSVLWARKEGGIMAENAYGVTVDSQNNIVLTGQFQGTASIASQTVTSIIDPVTMLPSFDLFIAKYDPNGTPLWMKTGLADYEDRGLAVATDAANNVFLTGQFSDTLVFAGQTFNNDAYNVGFLAKFNASGQLQWMNTLRAGMVIPYDLEVNSVDEVVITGDFLGNMAYFDANGLHNITNPYDRQVFVLKTANNGNYIWDETLGSDSEVSARSVSIDSQKDIFVTGYFKCSFGQLQETDETIFHSAGYKDPYLIKVSNAGSLVYAKQLGGKMDDEGHGVAVRTTNEPVICGSYSKDLMVMRDQNETYTEDVDPFGLFSYWTENPHLYLQGDSTRNSFLLKAIQPNTPDLVYYLLPSTDSLLGEINGGLDTAHFCVHGTLQSDPLTWDHLGPSYHYLWNTGDTTRTIPVNITGSYNVFAERDDVCTSGRDTIEVVIHQPPHLPLMSDNIPILSESPAYTNYHFCHPDSVQIWFTQVDQSATFGIYNANGLLYSDSLPHFYDEGGMYTVQAATPYCMAEQEFYIQFDYPMPYDTLDLYLKLYDPVDNNDTIEVCINDPIYIYALDFFTNPAGNYIQPSEPVVDETWSVSPAMTGGSVQDFKGRFFPQATGSYIFHYDVAIGFDNLCDLDTVIYHATDTFYFIVHPTPVIATNIMGNPLICPGDTAYLYTTLPDTNLSWAGPGINWMSNDEDSIQIILPGNYSYSGTIIDPLTGCSGNTIATIFIQPKTLPNIGVFPSDAIICPYDSVLLSLPNTYVSYDWIGPTGASLSLTNTVYGHDAGFYYCHVTDDEGCSLTTPPFELKEFTTPHLLVEPSNVICTNETITISAIHFGNASIQWTSPINSSSDQITVTQPGVYYCQIQQCGLTFYDSVEIIDGSFNVSLLADDTLLCQNETSILTATPGLGTYQWSNGTNGPSSISVTEEGDYWVSVMNSYGCEAQSNTVHISESAAAIPPVVSDLSICPGSDATLMENSSFTTLWFTASDTLFLQSGSALSINDVYSDTSFLVAYQNTECPPVYDVVWIHTIDSLPDAQIMGDSLLCPGEDALFSIAPAGLQTSWYNNGVNIGSSATILLNQTDFNADSVLTAVISNGCFFDTISEPVYMATPAVISISSDSLLLCAYSEATLSVIGDVATIQWGGNFGTVEEATLTVSSAIGDGWITATAIDNNGCSTNTDSVLITVSDLTYAMFQELGNSCMGDSISFGVTTTADSLLWTTPNGLSDTTAFSFLVSEAVSGWYYLDQWDDFGCVYQDSLYIAANPLPEFELGTDTLLCINDIYTYYFPNDSNSYSWVGLGELESFPVEGNQWVILTATSPQGCLFSDTLFIETVDCENALPNVITPNNDGVNDYFVIDEAPIFPGNELVIMNRWGNVILNVTGYRNDFNGLELSEGTYFYVFRRDPVNEPAVKKEGFFEIIR